MAWLILALILDPDAAAEADARAALPPHLAALVADRTVTFSARERPEGMGLDAGEVVEGNKLVVYRLPLAGDVPRGAEVRAVLYAWLYAADQQMKWSDDLRWRAQIRWSVWPGTGNLAQAGARGASPRGAFAASVADLLFPPPDDATTGSNRGLSAVDRTLDCRDPARARLLRTLLALPAGPERCPAFEAWARLDALAAIEVNLASPSGVSLASLFGHVFLRLIYSDARGREPATRSVAVAYLAERDFSDDRFYAWHGLIGSYAVRLFEVPFEQVYQGYVIAESRDIRRWRLVLSPAQRRRLMERLWAGREGEAWRYFFFSRNCASLLMELLHDVLGEGVPTHPGLLGKAPGAALDALERAGPLTPVPSPFLGRHTVAREAERARTRLEPALLAEAPGLGAALAEARTTEAARTAAYAQVGREGGARAAPWLRESIAVELALSPDGRQTPPLVALQQAQADLRHRLGTLAPSQPPELQAESPRWPHPGVDQLSLLGRYTGVPSARLQVAGFEERLGDQRRHGVGGEVELVLLASRLDVGAGGIEGSESRVIGYRTIRPGLPGEGGLPGWGFAVDAGHAGDARGVTGEFSLIFPLAAAAGGARHLLLGAGLAPGFQHDGAAHVGLEVPLDLVARWGTAGHALALQGRLRPGLDVRGTPTLGHRLGLTGRLGIWPEGPAGLGISLEAGVEHTAPTGLSLPTWPGLTSTVGLRFE